MPDTEYELGWLAFSGNVRSSSTHARTHLHSSVSIDQPNTKQKHEKFDKSDELVGLIYDGAYSCLRNGDDEEGQPSVDEL
jgi:hypothetical protein